MLKQDDYTHHISGQFNVELETLRNHMLEMGGKVEQQLSNALEALVNMDSGHAELIINQDHEVNQMEMSIDDQCASILARRHPAASDLRLTQLESFGAHYVRTLRLWRERLRAVRGAGYHAIDVYTPWNYHESTPDAWDFEGERDVAVLIQGVWVRPGDWLYADEDGVVVHAGALS